MRGCSEFDKANPTTFGIEFAENASQFNLIGLPELVSGVALEVPEGGDRKVRRVKIDEVAPARFLGDFAEVLGLQLRTLQDGGSSENVVAGIKVGRLV